MRPEIADLQLAYLSKRVEERGIELTYTDKVKSMIAKEGYDPIYGARPLKRLIQKKLQDALALRILKGEIKDGDRVRLDADAKGNVVFKTL